MNTTIKTTQTFVQTQGAIARTHPKSFIMHYAPGSPMGDNLNEENPQYKGKPVVILQLVYLFDRRLAAELIRPEYLNQQP